MGSAPRDGTPVFLLFDSEDEFLGRVLPRVRIAHLVQRPDGSAGDWSVPYYAFNPPVAWQPLNMPMPPNV
jgi:hypothetical protein